MSLIAIVNLAERLLDQSPGHDSPGQSGAKLAGVKDGEDATAVTQDHFTPSAATDQDHATAQAAGLFRASQVTFFSAAADFLLAQTAPQTANPPAQALPTAAPAAQAVSAVPPREPLIPLGPVATTAASLPGPAAPTGAGSAGATNALASATAAPGSNSTASSLSQLQALNNALASLGLNAQQLAQVDRIASLIQDFNPTAFLSLVHQLEVLAQANSDQPAAANAANSAVPGSNSPAPANAPATNNSNGATSSGFQLRELMIKFSGGQETLTGGANGNGGNSTLQLSAFNLQVEEVNLTLTNNAGQTLQVQAPQPAANAPDATSAGGAQTTLKAIAATG
jgi:hypothetical protein